MYSINAQECGHRCSGGVYAATTYSNRGIYCRRCFSPPIYIFPPAWYNGIDLYYSQSNTIFNLKHDKDVKRIFRQSKQRIRRHTRSVCQEFGVQLWRKRRRQIVVFWVENSISIKKVPPAAEPTWARALCRAVPLTDRGNPPDQLKSAVSIVIIDMDIIAVINQVARQNGIGGMHPAAGIDRLDDLHKPALAR